jgi:phosphoglucomutase
MERMSEIMADLRAKPPVTIGGLTVTRIDDYKQSFSVNTETSAKTVITLPKSDVIAFNLTDNASVIIRPSGTEPKIKVYFTTTGEKRSDAESLQAKLAEDFKAVIGF